MDILTGLNKSQCEGVCNTKGPALILAGAGAGKTRVLTTRIAHLILYDQVLPQNILAITFTNKAAAEMKSRVEEMLPHRISDIWISTFHSACVRILRRQESFMEYKKNFVIYDDADKLSVIKQCLKELNLDDKKFPPRAISSGISAAKNNLKTPQEYKVIAVNYYQKTVASVYEQYQKKLIHNNALDFDDLILNTVLLLKTNQVILNYYQDKFQYILVDEYQDTNYAQYVLVNLLAQKYRNICVVGDPDQSIYRFRGADMENILNFENDYPEARVILLEQNYRSTSTILDSANQVIKNNKYRKEKNLWTKGEIGDPIVVYTGYSENEEAAFIVDRVLCLKDNGYSYKDQAILYRTHAQSRVLEEKLLTAGIPYTMIGGLKFYERKEIKDLIAYLKLLINPNDEVNFNRIINVPKRGIGKISAEKILQYAYTNKKNFIEVLISAGEITGLNAKARSAAVNLGKLLLDLNNKREEINITSLVETTLYRTGYWHSLEEDMSKESAIRQENLQEFMSVTKDYDHKNPQGDLEDFLFELALVTDIDHYDQRTDQVTMMTLHSAKGLEFPIVFLVGMEEGVFPHFRSLTETAEMEEERRLCYVGITRARERLYLTNCQQRTLFGTTTYNKPSRFLNEIPSRYITTKDLLSRKTMSRPHMTAPKGASSASNIKTFLPGDLVRHPKWGEGIVKDVRKRGNEQEVKVDFLGQGVKTLLTCYAPLEIQEP